MSLASAIGSIYKKYSHRFQANQTRACFSIYVGLLNSSSKCNKVGKTTCAFVATVAAIVAATRSSASPRTHQITEGALRYEGVTRLRGLATGAAPSEELEPPRQEKVISQKHVKGITAAVFLGFLGFPN
jgi:hypothetical protein